ncbi:MAG: hypothetical protein CM15mP102_06820 [Flavobacteriales bacterium]|nr:MAG: hypothetical protein CM15mP102_06820 [Flavobacteriales bacterium]
MAPNTLQRLRILNFMVINTNYQKFMTVLNINQFFSEIDGNIDSFRQNLQIVYTKDLSILLVVIRVKDIKIMLNL